MTDKFQREFNTAVKRRILEEVSKRAEHAQIVNNLYGHGGSHEGTLQDRMPQSSEEDPFDYMVDIERSPVGEKGWKKTVHRYRAPKK